MSHDSPKDAATMVLADLATWPAKVLLLKRHKNAAFLPGAFVFPGGKLEDIDITVAKSLTKEPHALDHLAAQFSLSHENIAIFLAAALRESCEESGLVLKPMLKSQDNHAHNKHDYLVSMTDIHGISFWVTPKSEVRRYNTCFFFVPLKNVASLNREPASSENTEKRWLFPKEALDLYEAGQIFLAPPTRAVLERLASSSSLKDFLAAVDAPIRPIHPYFIEENGQTILVLPGDKSHHEKWRSNFVMHTRYRFP
jgi:8-oxo-dGTP pyrophosphatase MutT (NUDIX family)